LLADDRLSIQRLRWSGTRLRLPPQCRAAQWRDALAGTQSPQDPVDLAAILPRLPIALLIAQPQ
jgi:maltooligosyltrehalose synthase